MKRSVNMHQRPTPSIPLCPARLSELRPLRSYRGVTLIELVIVMVIVAILASIAVPSYNTYLLQSRRADAKSALLNMASLEERYFSVNNKYTSTTTDLGYTGPWPVTVGSVYYQIIDPTPLLVAATAPTAAVPGGTPASYTLTAVPIGPQVNDTQCLNFVLTSAGLKTNSGPLTTCWN